MTNYKLGDIVVYHSGDVEKMLSGYVPHIEIITSERNISEGQGPRAMYVVNGGAVFRACDDVSGGVVIGNLKNVMQDILAAYIKEKGYD